VGALLFDEHRESLRDLLAAYATSSSPTLVMLLQEGCEYCAANMPLYSRLIEERNRRGLSLKILVAAPRRNSNIEKYLRARNVHPDGIVFFGPNYDGPASTPILALADTKGTVRQAWAAFIAPDQEKLVVEELIRFAQALSPVPPGRG
jgi:hypothetical protein